MPARPPVPVLSARAGAGWRGGSPCIEARRGQQAFSGPMPAGPTCGGEARTTQYRHLLWKQAETIRKDAAMDKTLAAGDLERLRKDFSANPSHRLAQNAVTRVTVDDVAIDREVVRSNHHSPVQKTRDLTDT